MNAIESSNRARMLSVYAAFADGHLDPLFDVLDENVEWVVSAPREFFRFGGTFRGRAGLKEYTALLFLDFHFTRFAPRATIAAGDQVWATFAVEVFHRASKKHFPLDITVMWTMKNGRLLAHRCVFDTAQALLQMGELPTAA
ncbi:MAG: nuclear transport factor 2 family protein [Alphaproteobacteria bacterium]|nr:nuclear transport factor 2 family protein [Alphaproteobacteria bacterium]